MPWSLQARMTRTAISPRLATRTFCSGLTSGTCLLLGGRILRESMGRESGPSGVLGCGHGTAPVRPHRRGRAPVGGTLGRRDADARGDLVDAGPAARAGPARQRAQAVRADLRPLRGTRAADLLLPRLAPAGQDGGA